MSFYRQVDSTRFESTPLTAGPWSPQAQHGGPPAALLARAIENHEPVPDTRLASVRADILGPIPVAPLDIEVTTVRAGRSMWLVEATASALGKPVITARGWRLTRSPADFPTMPGTRAEVAPTPPPASCTAPTKRIPHAHMDGYLSVIEWRYAHHGQGVAHAWGRQTVPLVDSEDPTPWQRTLVLADSGGGISYSLNPAEHLFINCDLYVALDRDLDGEWLLMKSESLAQPGGGGLVRTVFADERGEIGMGLQTMVAQNVGG